MKYILAIFVLLAIAFLCGWQLARSNRAQREAPSIERCGWQCDEGRQYPSSVYAQVNKELAERLRDFLTKNGFAEDDLVMFAVPSGSNAYDIIWVQTKHEVHLPNDEESHILDWLQDRLHQLSIIEESKLLNQAAQVTVPTVAELDH